MNHTSSWPDIQRSKLQTALEQRDAWQTRARELATEVERLRDGIKQHEDAINTGAWPGPSAVDIRLWALLDEEGAEA